MSVKLPLQAIFSHLYPAEEPDRPPASPTEAEVAPPVAADQVAGKVDNSALQRPPDEYDQRIANIDGDLATQLSHSHAAADQRAERAQPRTVTQRVERRRQIL